jgi:hypothetical protein
LSCTPSLGLPFSPAGAVSGTGGNVAFTQQGSFGGDQIGIATVSFAFNGVLNNGVITGTANYSEVWSGPTANGPVSGGGSTTLAVTLR